MPTTFLNNWKALHYFLRQKSSLVSKRHLESCLRILVSVTPRADGVGVSCGEAWTSSVFKDLQGASVMQLSLRTTVCDWKLFKYRWSKRFYLCSCAAWLPTSLLWGFFSGVNLSLLFSDWLLQVCYLVMDHFILFLRNEAFNLGYQNYCYRIAHDILSSISFSSVRLFSFLYNYIFTRFSLIF